MPDRGTALDVPYRVRLTLAWPRFSSLRVSIARSIKFSCEHQCRRRCENWCDTVAVSSTSNTLKVTATDCMLPPVSSLLKASFQRSWTRPIAQVHRERGSRSKIRGTGSNAGYRRNFLNRDTRQRSVIPHATQSRVSASGACVVRLENYRCANFVGMCSKYNIADPIQRIQREDCLEKTQSRTHWFGHLLHGLKVL
jgi:hypothetical protein